MYKTMGEEKPQKKERSESQLAYLAAARVKALSVRKENAALRKQEREVEAAALKDLVKERRERVHKEHKQLVQEEPEPEDDDEEELVEETRVVKKKRKKPPIRRRVVVVEESDDEDVPEEDVTEVHVPKAKPPDPLDRVRDRLFGAY